MVFQTRALLVTRATMIANGLARRCVVTPANFPEPESVMFQELTRMTDGAKVCILSV